MFKKPVSLALRSSYGFAEEFTMIIAQALKFNINGIQYNDTKTAFLAFMHNQVDAALTITTYNCEFEIFGPIETKFYYVYFKTPNLIVSSTYFLNIFDKYIWMTLLVLVLIMFIILVFNNYLSRNSIFTLIETIFFVFGLTAIHSNRSVYKLSLNIVCIMFSILSIIVGTSVSAFLCAKLSYFNDKLPFNNLHEIMNQNTFLLCVNKKEIGLLLLKHMYDNKNVMNPSTCQIKWNQKPSSISNTICANPHLMFMTTELIDSKKYLEYSKR